MAQAAATEPKTDASRTAYHFQPAKNWINDPNGPMYYKGLYHIFYQHNPFGPLWGNLSWGHSVSRDLVNWAPLPLALEPSAEFDKSGCWSGSTTFLLDREQPVFMYTGLCNSRQVQNLAFPADPADPLLVKWTKPGYNPVIVPCDDIDPKEFRDPSTAWKGSDGLWRVAVTAKIAGNGAMVAYTSEDFRRWKRVPGVLLRSSNSGMWECVDFFPVASPGCPEALDVSANGDGVKHVAKWSLINNHKEYYSVGTFTESEGGGSIFEPEDGWKDDFVTWRMMDFGNLYAVKTFYDPKLKRRIIWAWSTEADTKEDAVKKGWSGIMCFLRSIWLDSDGKTLVQWPVQEIETLRRREIFLQNIELKSGSKHEIVGITALQADVEVVFEFPSLEGAEEFNAAWLLDVEKLCKEKNSDVPGGIGPFGLLVLSSDDLHEYTAVCFRVFRDQNRYRVLMFSDLSRSSSRDDVEKPFYGGFVDIDISEDRRISLRTLIDHSVIESFGGGGRACITARVYPQHISAGDGAATHLHAFNNGTGEVKIVELKAWEMAAARMDLAHADL